ncbi:MAG TPA: protein phosphatase 2C domain-containing protein [Ktedonobacterales bacterium]|nr:protein phosphatase 2C domain-containing protein [Ktedonobacterales bacterium]
MTTGSGRRGGLLAVTLLCLVSSVALALPSASPALAYRQTPVAGLASTRPSQAVAYARIGVVRVLTYYNGAISGDTAPVPWPSPCAADGALVGTSGAGLNTFSYVLLPTAAVDPLVPCAGVQAGFQQLNGRATGWSISHIDVLLDVAYTGIGPAQMGAVKFSIDPGLITTNGGQTAPPLLTFVLCTIGCAVPHDLPVLAPPQPSDPPADPASALVLDLTPGSGQLLGRDSVTSSEVATTLYPVTVPADQLSAAASIAGGTPTPVPQQTAVGGTVVPPTATKTAQFPADTPTALSARVSLGAPEIDSNGRLIGMVVADAQGRHVLAPLPAVIQAIGQVSSKPGTLMTEWQQALAAYYTSPPEFSQAAAAFAGLAATYPDFGGVEPFEAAAQQQSTTIPALTTSGPIAPSSPEPPAPSAAMLAALAGLAAAALLVLLIASTLLLRRRRTRAVAPAIPDEEAALDLLPRDVPLDTLVLPALPASDSTDEHANGTSGTITVTEAPAVGQSAIRPRQGLALMQQAAGLTDAGVRRAADPNQDNILALQGVRVVDGRPQAYGLFIVADGMGGHLNGREASRLAIEIVTSCILQTLESTQALDEATVKRLLIDAADRADAELRRRNVDEHLDMGTTMTAALVVDDLAYVVNVGDSRTYLMSPESGLRQITADHSVVATLASAGIIQPEDIYTHPRRNQIYRSLGGEHSDSDIDVFEVPLQAGDKLLLCSDGLWEMVRDPQIESILRGLADPQQAAELLVREANANGGDDNVSAIVVRLIEDIPQAAHAGGRVLMAPQDTHLLGDR